MSNGNKIRLHINRLRKINLVLSASALFFGILIYVLFSHNKYTEMFLSGRFYIESSNRFFIFLRCRFADFLWCFSFACALSAVWFSVNRKSVVFIGVFTLLMGTSLEVMQYMGFINGTGDFYDVIMYTIASALYFILNLKLLKD